MTEPIVYLNGEFLPASEAKLNIFDYAVVMGATFTEMTRTFSHHPFRLEDHVARLFRSLEYGGISIPLSFEEVLETSCEVARRNSDLLARESDLAIVQFVTPGENLMYAGTLNADAPSASTPLSPTVCIHTFPLAFNNRKYLFHQGAHCVTPTVRHIPSQCIDANAKHRSRLHWWLAEREVQTVDPHALSLLLNMDGFITECAGANFLMVKNRTIFSPRAYNILVGISLQTTRELSTALGYEWIEKDLKVEDVLSADEAWLTTTPYCIAPCTRLNGTAVGDGEIGPRFRQLLAAWNARVGLDIEAQILNAQY